MASKSIPQTTQRQNRRGVFIVLAAFVMIVLFAFLSLGLDSGLIAMEQTRLQNAVDAAALAASQEITSAVQSAGDGGDPNSISLEHARAMATDVADRNGIYVDASKDVVFGKRTYNEGTGKWDISWNEGPYNVVKVTARRDQTDMSARDSRVPLAFGWAVGTPTIALRAEAIAFVEARDMVVVLDFSGSMNDDSRYTSIGRLGQENIEANMVDIFNAMNPNVGDLSFDQKYLTVVGQPPSHPREPQITVTFKDREVYVESTKDLSNVVLEFDNGYHYKYDGLSGKTRTFRGPGSYNGRKIVGCWVKSGSNASGDGPGYGERFRDTNQAVKEAFGLDGINYPYRRGSWDEYINYCRDNISSSSGNRQKYGKQNFVDYLLSNRYHNYETEDLWKAPHYPFHAVKNGFSLFLDFLQDLDFGDEVGIVSYDESSRVEHTLNDGNAYANLNGNLISDDYDSLDTIQRHKQAGHYGSYTAMGFGVDEADELLQAHSRHGARPTIVLMTDGNANRYKSGWRLPNDWDWDDYTDYDGDGHSDYSTNDRSKQYAIWEAVEAHKRGVTIHTMSVGANADRDVMTAIANACGGIHISVPGGSTIAELEAQMLSAFQQIAAKVPPPQLVYDLSQAEN
ncbi:pilus assembly protein TadG-related protein [Bremerella sp.]|uniref:pilus assembly protein TadG-related protein n=1 Tax=Bremerella sp. TaxID=2795602 RepID=UPI00391C1E73